MSKATLSSLFLSLTILTVGSFGGMAVTWKLAGTVKSRDFLYFGLIIQSSIFFFQILAFYRARTELLSHIRYLATFGLTMAWVMYCLIFPVFLVDSIQPGVKLTLIGIIILLAFSNFFYAAIYVGKQWTKFGLNEFNKLFNPAKNSVDWDKVIHSMNIQPAIYMHGLNESLATALSVLLFVSMLAGLSVRSIYPAFAVFAYGIPAAVVASFFLQVAGYYFGQALVVGAIQKERRIKMRSGCD